MELETRFYIALGECDLEMEDELTLSDISDTVDDEDEVECKRCQDQGCNRCLMTGY